MQPKTERFEMRLDQEMLDRVDRWRGRQDDTPTRAEAIRRLIENGLGGERGTVHFSDGEKLMLSMLTDISKHLKIKDGVDADLVADAIYGGHYWALKWELQGVLHDHSDSQRAVKQTVDILDMWSFIESGYRKLSKKDKERVKAEADLHGDAAFRGFDGNNETEHLGIARFLIDKMRRFESFKGRDLNSHSPSIDGYLRMCRLFESMRPNLGMGRELDADAIITLLKARWHPEYAARRDNKKAS